MSEVGLYFFDNISWLERLGVRVLYFNIMKALNLICIDFFKKIFPR
jgi:hypothetical protein